MHLDLLFLTLTSISSQVLAGGLQNLSDTRQADRIWVLKTLCCLIMRKLNSNWTNQEMHLPYCWTGNGLRQLLKQATMWLRWIARVQLQKQFTLLAPLSLSHTLAVLKAAIRDEGKNLQRKSFVYTQIRLDLMCHIATVFLFSFRKESKSLLLLW